MENELTGITREQTSEFHSVANSIPDTQKASAPTLNGQDLNIPQDTEMVSVLSLVAKEHQEYVSKTYKSVGVEIDGHKFMLNPRQLVPKRAKILTSKVRASDDGDGNKKPVPVGIGGVAGGSKLTIN